MWNVAVFLGLLVKATDFLKAAFGENILNIKPAFLFKKFYLGSDSIR